TAVWNSSKARCLGPDYRNIKSFTRIAREVDPICWNIVQGNPIDAKNLGFGKTKTLTQTLSHSTPTNTHSNNPHTNRCLLLITALSLLRVYQSREFIIKGGNCSARKPR